MLFNSFHFLIFFPVVVIAYFALPHRFRWVFLLLASYYFYMSWKPEYIILIIISTCIDFWSGKKIHLATEPVKKKLFLSLSLASNLGILFAFKYFNFFSDSARLVFNSFNIFYDMPAFDVLLPVGISFYTFQTMSYSIDVYRGKKEPEKHFGIFALYVSFFPQLVAGPIERSTHLLPQFKKVVKYDYTRITDGLKLILWGLFKKVVIADRLAKMVDYAYANPTDQIGISFMIATVMFAFQIYCDFSGYSDIAIGVSKILGFNLMDNFNRPYFSKSIGEFWRRWHISLSTWFRDYVYIPLGGNRHSKLRWYLNLFLVFLISGLWHGANWTYIIWGSLHGFYLIVGLVTLKYRAAISQAIGLKGSFIEKPIQVAITFSLVCFAWIFFRANNVNDAFYIITHLFDGNIDYFNYVKNNLSASGSGKLEPLLLGASKSEFMIAILAIMFMEGIHSIQRHQSIRQLLSTKAIWIRWPIYYLLIMFIVFFGVFDEAAFLYFQF